MSMEPGISARRAGQPAAILRHGKSLIGTVLAALPGGLNIVLFYLAYVAAGGLGQGLAIIPGVSITFWPPAGIFVAVLLLTARSSWPWWVAVACLAELTCNAIWFHNAVGNALIYFGANALEALAAAWMLGSVTARPFLLNTLEQVVKFIVLGAGIAPMVGATVIATTDQLLGKHPFFEAWPLVWLGDGTGLLVSAPLTLVAFQVWQGRGHLPRLRFFEGLFLAAVLIGATELAFHDFLPTVYVTMLPLLWIAVRFQLRGAAVALGVLVLLSAINAAGGEGEFAGGPEGMRDKIVELQAFIGISALASLFVAALSQQNHDAVRALKEANAGLEARVAARTADLSEREEQFRRALDAAGALVYTAGLEPGGVARVHGMESVTGYDPRSVQPTNEWWWSLIHPDDYDGYMANSTQFIDDGTRRRIVYRIRHADGTWRYLEENSEVIRGAGGQASRIVGTLVDITEQKEAETALVEAQRFSQGLIDAQPNILYIFDLIEQRNVYINQQITTVLGYRPEEFQTAGADIIPKLVHPGDLERLAEFLEKLEAEPGGTPHQVEHRMRHKDGRWIWLSVQGIVYERDAAGRATRVLGTAHDIMHQKQQEEHNQLLMREVSHRSKNVLSLVQAIARQTAKHDPGKFLPKFFDRLASLAAALDALVNNDWKGVMLGDLVKSQLAHFGGLLDTRIAISGPALTVSAATAQSLGLAIHELATNAGKYGALSDANGKIDVRWDLTGETDGTQKFSISWTESNGPEVRDKGHRGFGSTVVKRMCETALDAEVVYDMQPSGIEWRLSCDASRVLEENRGPES